MFKSKLFSTCFALALTSATPLLSNAASIESMGYSESGADGVKLALMFSEPVSSPHVFEISNHELSFLFDKTTVKPDIKTPAMGQFRLVDNASIIEQADSSILSVKLNKQARYNLSRSGNILLISLGQKNVVTADPTLNAPTPKTSTKKTVESKTPSKKVAPVKPKAVPPKPEPVADSVDKGNSSSDSKVVKLEKPLTVLTDKEGQSTPSKSDNKKLKTVNVDSFNFRRITDTAKAIFSLSGLADNVKVIRNAGTLNVVIPDSTLSDDLTSKYDVRDFASHIDYVQARQDGKDVSVLMVLNNEDIEFSHYQLDNELIVEVKQKKEVKADSDFNYTGELITLDFQSIELRAVLKLLADFTGLNLITSDTVKGSLTINLVKVPWDQALDLILKSKGLAMRKQGNVLLIAPASEVAVREKQELINKKQALKLKNISSKLIEINFAEASDIAKLIESSSSQSSSVDDAEVAGFLSERGKVSIDERTNSLLVWDTLDRLEKIEEMVKKLDRPIRQVLIESRIVIANSDFGRELGARFGVSGSTAGSVSSSVSGTLSDISVSGGELLNSGQIGSPSNTSSISSNQGLNVNLPVASPAGSLALSLARLPAGDLLQLELSAMQSEGKGQIVSSPKVITSHKKTALIKQGTEIPYQEASSSGATSVSFKEALLKLEVTPQITPNNQIIMDIDVSKDAVGTIFNGVPSINTQGVETQVLVDDGDTVVLGGIHEKSNLDTTMKVPLLGDLPYVGALFRNTNKTEGKSELLVFITPKIIRESLSRY
jgi:type IV pilus assembly protein PilQ